VNRLSLARMFLFGARDVWFVVGIPVYFQSVLSDGTAEGRREAFFLIGGFLALWIIAYGAVQAFAPRFWAARASPRPDHPQGDPLGGLWCRSRCCWRAAWAAAGPRPG
jgi:hypothetical protein